MAYDASNNDSDQTQVAGSAPLSQGDGMAAPAQTPQEGGSTPSATPISTGASVNQAASQGQAQSKASPKASSGMFTNIQKYVQKNKPQAQKMSKAVTQDFSKKAEGIRQVAQQKQSQQQQALSANQAAMQQQQQEAQQLVAQAGTGQSSDDSSTRFQELMKGPQIQEVGDINLAQQQMRSQALQNLAQGSQREEGRRNLMREAFGDRAYTRGQAGLDELILGGSQAAREDLIEGTQGQASDLQQALRNMQQRSAADVGLQREVAGQFGQDIEGLARNPYEDIVESGEVEAQRRMEEFGTQQVAFEEALKSGNIAPEMLDQYISDKQYNKLIGEASKRRDKLADYIYSSEGNRKYNTANEARRYAELAGLGKKELRQMQQDFVQESLGKIPTSSYEKYKKTGGSMGMDAYKRSRQMQQSNVRTNAVRDFQKQLADKIRGQKVDKASIQSQLAELAKGGKLRQYLSGPSAANISAQSVSTPEQIARQQALANLMGVESQWVPETQQVSPTEGGQFNVEDIEGLYSNLFKV